MPIAPTPKIYGAAANMWCIHVMPPTAAKKCRYCADRGPRARCDQMVVVMRLGVSFGHLRILHLSVTQRRPRHSVRAYVPLRPDAGAASLSTCGVSACRPGYMV